MTVSLVSVVSRCDQRGWGYVIIGIVALMLLGCQPETPAPTPTATRTPVIPTATPTETPTPTLSPTPTQTPTPTPTLPPGLVLPPTPVSPEGWPSLPSNLYYLNEGNLSIWLAEGEHVDSIPVSDEVAEEDIVEYQVFEDGQAIVYVTEGGGLYRFNRVEWSNTRLPVTGRLVHEDRTFFEVLPTDSRLIYLAWGVQPTAEHRQMSLDSAGTLLMMDLSDPRQQQLELGFCLGDEVTPCGGFTMAPDGQSLVMSDIQGFHLIRLDDDEEQMHTQLLSAAWADGTERVLGWSPDSRWFIFERRTDESAQLIITDVEVPELPQIQLPLCASDCAVEIDWSGMDMWVAINRPEGGCLYRQPMDATIPTSPDEVTCTAHDFDLYPTDIRVLSGEEIALLHQGSKAMASGIYIYQPSLNSLNPVALLSDAHGRMLWSEDGSAFLAYDRDGAPKTLGWIDHGVLLDVSTRFQGATKLRWERIWEPVQ